MGEINKLAGFGKSKISAIKKEIPKDTNKSTISDRANRVKNVITMRKNYIRMVFYSKNLRIVISVILNYLL